MGLAAAAVIALAQGSESEIDPATLPNAAFSEKLETHSFPRHVEVTKFQVEFGPVVQQTGQKGFAVLWIPHDISNVDPKSVSFDLRFRTDLANDCDFGYKILRGLARRHGYRVKSINGRNCNKNTPGWVYQDGSVELDAGSRVRIERILPDSAGEVTTPQGKSVAATVHNAQISAGRIYVRAEANVSGRLPAVTWEGHVALTNIKCTELPDVVKTFAEQKGYSVSAVTLDTCGEANELSKGKVILKGAAPQACKADAYLGAWQHKGEGGQKPQVQIVFATERGASAPVGSTRGFASAPYGDGTVVASRIRQVGDGCTFDAQCGANLSSANACKLVIDPAKNTLKVEGGSQMFVSDRVWTRTTPRAVETVCSREDVEGDWRRSDGANVPIVGVHVFKNGPGGNALLFNHPEGWWPKGQTKFTGIYREGGDRSCKLKATCATYDRTVSGNVVRRERACTLTIDPVKKRMTESGSSLFYTRNGAATGPGAKSAPTIAQPAKPDPSAEEKAATSSLNAQQAVAAKREVAEYEAQKKRIADEQAAKEAAYRKALADREALIAETDRKAREAQAKWEAAVAACKAGDHSQCGPVPK
ncbi:MAG: hypothetical protein C0520_04395 [Sphingopyxis sp.]|nr:hypothetical protein [Sphingopyxis sp.]